MRKRAKFDLQNYLITFLIFVGVMVTFGTVAYNLGSDYETLGGAVVDGEFKDTYSQLGIIETYADDTQEKLEQADTGTASADTQFYGDALNSIKLVFNSIGTARSMISNMAVAVGVPLIWQQIAITGLIIMILTTIVFMIFKSRGTT